MSSYQHGPFRVEENRLIVERYGLISLSPQEGRIVCLLVQSKGVPVPRARLMEEALRVKEDNRVTQRRLMVHLSHVRRKLNEKRLGLGASIINVRRTGYVLRTLSYLF